MKGKKTLSILLALTLIFGILCTSVSAALDTTVYQETYKRQFEEIQSSEKLSDTDKISQIINLFFNAKIHNYKLPDVDLSFFLDTKNNSFEANKIINAVKLRDELYRLDGIKILSDKLTLTVDEINVTNNEASVKLYELYEYQLDSVDLPSARGILCTVNLSKINNKWLITSIVSNDEFITDDMGSESFNVKYEANRILSNIPMIISEVPPPDYVPDISTSGTYHPINRTIAATYAYNHAYSPSSMFPYYPIEMGGDCANFGSQCVWAGVGGTMTAIDTYWPPMYSGWYSYNNWAPESWNTVHGFYGASVGGGTELYAVNNGYSYYAIQPGDILQLKSGSTYFHTYVVNAVTGSYGSRTINDIYICSHTSDRLNEPLYACWTGEFRHIIIYGATY